MGTVIAKILVNSIYVLYFVLSFHFSRFIMNMNEKHKRARVTATATAMVTQTTTVTASIVILRRWQRRSSALTAMLSHS